GRKAMQALQFNVAYAADEDTLQNVLASLASQCDRLVQGLLQRIDQTAAGSDPARFNKAEADLTAARQLVAAFGQDASRIEQKAAWLRNVQITLGMTPPPPPVGNDVPADGKRQIGLEKLNRVRLEVRA